MCVCVCVCVCSLQPALSDFEIGSTPAHLHNASGNRLIHTSYICKFLRENQYSGFFAHFFTLFVSVDQSSVYVYASMDKKRNVFAHQKNKEKKLQKQTKS